MSLWVGFLFKHHLHSVTLKLGEVGTLFVSLGEVFPGGHEDHHSLQILKRPSAETLDFQIGCDRRMYLINVAECCWVVFRRWAVVNKKGGHWLFRSFMFGVKTTTNPWVYTPEKKHDNGQKKIIWRCIPYPPLIIVIFHCHLSFGGLYLFSQANPTHVRKLAAGTWKNWRVKALGEMIRFCRFQFAVQCSWVWNL